MNKNHGIKILAGSVVFAVVMILIRGSLQEGTKFPSTPLQPFASLGCSQYIDFLFDIKFCVT